jgi:hypothetical protein
VNADGYADLLLGAHQSDEGAPYAGKTYLLLGRADVTAWNGSDPLDLQYANASFVGEDTADISGSSVAGAGDVNNDGYADLLIGAPTTILGLRASTVLGMMGSVERDDPQLLAVRYNGTTYLLLGRSDVTAWNGSAPLDLQYANASFNGENNRDFSGKSVAGAGDINGDGVDDILIGTRENGDGGNKAGKTYLLLGVDTTLPTWTVTPTDQTVEFGAGLSYALSAVDLSGIDRWWVNDTAHFSVNASGALANATALSVGTYWVEVRAYDSSDNYCTATFKIMVQDTTAPTWIDLPTAPIIEITVGVDYEPAASYDLNASDLSGIDHWWVNDTIHFSIDSDGRISNATALSVGVYGLKVRAYDPYDNYCTAIFKITAQTTETTSESEDGSGFTMAILFGGLLTFAIIRQRKLRNL